jgi:signal transduction histidine kinase
MTRPLGAPGQGFAKIARDLTSQRAVAEALRGAHDDLERRVHQRTRELEAMVEEREAARQAVTQLLHKIVTAQEDERSRIARDLHDHLGQQLTALRLALERQAETGGDATARRETVDRALELVREMGRDLDFLAWELRPAVLDELGLAAALPRFVREWSSHVGIPAEFRSGAFEPGQLSPEAELTFYRIAQEALNNIAKHAQASRADVVLATSDGHVVLVIDDDGVGFEMEGESTGRSSFGMAGMRERASLIGATLQVESTPGQGTSVFLRCAVAAGPGEGAPPPGRGGEPS